jgi:uncharacterized protein YjiS (DUF1127 family)
MVAKLIDDVVSLLDRRCRARKIRIELEALSDEDLAELGLKRCDIRSVANETTRKY